MDFNNNNQANTADLLRKRIMRRVYFIWFTRHAAPPLAAQAVLLGLLFLGIHEYVSARFVARNAAEAIHSLPSLISFARAAVLNTGFVPQILFGAVFLLGWLAARDLKRYLKNFSRTLSLPVTARIS